MSRTATVKFRGQEMEVTYTDHGYESDTNAHVIEWEFVQIPIEPLFMTDDEEQNIYEQLLEASRDESSDYDDPPDRD